MKGNKGMNELLINQLSLIVKAFAFLTLAITAITKDTKLKIIILITAFIMFAFSQYIVIFLFNTV